MKETLGKLLKGAQSAAEMTETLAREGISSVQCGWQGMGLFRALSALSVPDLEKDETHYLLIPRPVASGEGVEFTLFSKRVIPEGYGANNSLPKERVFHLSDESVEDRLRSQLTESLIAREGESGGGDPLDLAGRLEALAEEVDKETDKVSGGMLIVGGLTTLINPVAGIGMMASGVLPKIGGKLVRSGASLAGDQLRDWSQKRMEKKVSSEVERLKPLIFINPILQRLEAVLTNPTEQDDPLLEKLDWGEGFLYHRYLQVTAEGLGEVYEDSLKKKKGALSAPVKTWLKSLAELGENS